MRNEGGDEDGEGEDEDDGKHKDKNGEVCKDLEQGNPGLADNCQILAVRSDICKIGQLSIE